MCKYYLVEVEKRGNMKRRLILLLLIIMLAAGCGVAKDTEQSYQRSETVMDTVATLSASGPNAKQAVDESMTRLKVLEAMTSVSIADSDVSKLTKSAGSGEWIKLNPEVYHLLKVSADYSKLTNGAWDITAGPFIKLWGIGSENPSVPTAAEIQQAKALVNWQNLELDESTQRARLMKKGMSIDLGGIAKGMALDEVRKIYANYGIEHGLINLGASSLYAIGSKADGNDWRVGLRHPRNEAAKAIIGIVTLSNAALSTSGDYERFFIKDGVRYHHIIDPKTGRPASNGAISITVIVDGSYADAGMISDLLTTAVFIMGPEQGRKFLQELSIKTAGAICDNKYTLWITPAFSQHLHQLDKNFSLNIEDKKALGN